jgi:hypothetical protein
MFSILCIYYPICVQRALAVSSRRVPFGLSGRVRRSNIISRPRDRIGISLRAQIFMTRLTFAAAAAFRNIFTKGGWAAQRRPAAAALNINRRINLRRSHWTLIAPDGKAIPGSDTHRNHRKQRCTVQAR